jgi:hypothetical protein
MKIFWRIRGEVTGKQRRLHNEEFYDLYYSPNIIRVTKRIRIKLMGHMARMKVSRGEYTVCVERTDGKRSFIRHSRRWGYNINVEL